MTRMDLVSSCVGVEEGRRLGATKPNNGIVREIAILIGVCTGTKESFSFIEPRSSRVFEACHPYWASKGNASCSFSSRVMNEVFVWFPSPGGRVEGLAVLM